MGTKIICKQKNLIKYLVPVFPRAGVPNSTSCIVEIQEIKNALNVLNSFQEHADIKEITDSTDTAIEFKNVYFTHA